MNIKILSSVIALAVCGTISSGVAQAATESSETTIERSTSVDVPKPRTEVKEESTTTTKRGLFGREKSKTTTSSSTSERDAYATPEVKSKTTTTESSRSY